MSYFVVINIGGVFNYLFFFILYGHMTVKVAAGGWIHRVENSTPTSRSRLGSFSFDTRGGVPVRCVPQTHLRMIEIDTGCIYV